MIDTARNFKPKEWLYKVLDAMALYKLNMLHLHLSDDEAWRLEIPGLPELTRVKPILCSEKMEFARVLNIFLTVSALKHRFWVPVRTASMRKYHIGSIRFKFLEFRLRNATESTLLKC